MGNLLDHLQRQRDLELNFPEDQSETAYETWELEVPCLDNLEYDKQTLKAIKEAMETLESHGIFIRRELI